MRRSVRLALALLAAPTALLAQAGLDTVQIRTQPLGGGVYVLFGSGGNIGLAVGDDAVFVVDDQFAQLTPKILAAIKAITPRPVRFVVNTHWHFDHTGGNENLTGAGALVIAHDNVRRRMSTDQFIAALNLRQPASPKAALPVVTFADAVTFHINDEEIKVTHVAPAHTDGDALVYFTKANVLHMGDVFNMAGLPFVDRSSGGSIHGVIAAAQQVLGTIDGNTKIVPGHGRVAGKAEIEAWIEMLVALRDRMQREIAAGKSVDQVLAAEISKPYAESWPGGHERFLRVLYEELSGK